MPAKIYFFPHPFTNERREETIESGASLESIVKNARSDIPHGLMVRTYVNGKLISNDDRIKTIVNDDDEIIIRIVPANGNTDREQAANTKAIGGAIASLALIAVGIVTGGVAWVAAGFAIGVASPFLAGLTSAGVIGGPYADEMGTINHPSIHGAQNQSNPNGKVPLVFGKHLMTPGYLSPPYTEISGVDGRDQYLHMSFVLGYAPLKVSNIQFGDMLVATNSSNVTNGTIVCDGVLPGCEAEIRQDSVSGTGLSLYPKEVIEQNLSTALARYHVLESDKELNGITITVNAAAKTFTRSSGNWTATGTKDTTNYADVRVGDYITFYGFSNAGNNKQFLVTGVSPTTIYCNQATGLVNEAKSGIQAIVVPSNIQTTAKNTTKIAVTITFPKLVKYSNNDKLNATVVVQPYYRLKAAPGATPNPWTLLGTFDEIFWHGSNTITRNKAETLRFVATSGTLPAGQYEVFVMRATEDATDSNIQDAVFWTSLQSFTDLDIMPANTRKKVAILGVKIKSSEAVQNCITKLNCIVSADYSYIVTKDRTHEWASIIATNPQNTALAFIHALMGAGNPRPRTAAQIDWNSVYAFAQWCNTLKGLSGSQYRIETNGIVTQGAKLSELIAQILSPARASLSMSDGTYGVVWDALQTTPKQHIGPHNSWGFRGTKSFGEVVHGYRIKFINSNEQYVIDERIVLDDGYKYDTEQDGVLRDAWGVDRTSDGAYTEATKFETIEAMYMTNPAQVFGFGRYLLATRRLRPELFTVNMDAENLAVKRGELVKVSHPAPRWGLADGRIAGLTTDEYGDILAVETDNAVFMEAGKDYAVRFRTSTGASIYWPVATVAGYTHTLTLSSGMPVNDDMPAVGDMFFFGIADLETIDCIVFGIDLNDDLSAKLTLFEAAPAVHNADAGEIPEFNSKVSFGPKASMPSTKTQVFPAGTTGPTGPAGQPAIIANLSNDSHTVPTDANGNNGNYTGCATTMSIFIGSTDDSANWTVSASPSAGITGSLSGRTYTVTNLTADTGYVDLTASRSGYSSITCRFTVSKAKGGIAYMLVVSAATIQKSQAGVYTPSTITVSAKSVASAGTVSDYAGRFVIAETTDGTSYTDKYTSSANETSKTYTPSAGIKALRCRLYLAGGTSTLLDEEIIPIVVDGPTGPQGPAGQNAITGVLSNDSHVVPTDANGNNGNYTGCATTMSIYVGSSDDSANWTVTATPSSGVTGSLSGKTYTVTAMSTDTGYVDLTASRSGYASVTCRFTISKAKQGAVGQNATAYWVVSSAAAISKSQAGVYTPTSLTFTGKSATGTASPVDYAGRFIIAETTDGSAWTDKYTSSSNESAKTYTPSAGIKAVRVRLYLEGGTTTLLDEEIIPIVVDGPTGPTGPQGPAGPQGPQGPAGADAPKYRGLYAYSSRGSITGMATNDLCVLYSTTASERGIYYYTGSAWTKVSSPTQDQIMRCMLGVLDAVRQGYGTSADYIGAGATSFETLLVNFLYAQFALITGSIRAGTRYNADGTEAYPTQDGVWIGSNGKIKGAINDVEPDQITPSFTLRQLFTSSGSWAVPAHIKWVRVTCMGGGGGGGGSGGATNGGRETASTVYNGGNGSAGGTSSFGSYVSATGGAGGLGTGGAGAGATGNNGASTDYIGGYNGASGGAGTASGTSSGTNTGTLTSGAGGGRGSSAGLYDAAVEQSNASAGLTKAPAISTGASKTNSASSSSGAVAKAGIAGAAGAYGGGGSGAAAGCFAAKLPDDAYAAWGASGGGGGAGALRQCVFKINETYGQSITITVGAGGAGGAAGDGSTAAGAVGGAGGNGWVLVEW